MFFFKIAFTFFFVWCMLQHAPLKKDNPLFHSDHIEFARDRIAKWMERANVKWPKTIPFTPSSEYKDFFFFFHFCVYLSRSFHPSLWCVWSYVIQFSTTSASTVPALRMRNAYRMRLFAQQWAAFSSVRALRSGHSITHWGMIVWEMGGACMTKTLPRPLFR